MSIAFTSSTVSIILWPCNLTCAEQWKWSVENMNWTWRRQKSQKSEVGGMWKWNTVTHPLRRIDLSLSFLSIACVSRTHSKLSRFFFFSTCTVSRFGGYSALVSHSATCKWIALSDFFFSLSSVHRISSAAGFHKFFVTLIHLEISTIERSRLCESSIFVMCFRYSDLLCYQHVGQERPSQVR